MKSACSKDDETQHPESYHHFSLVICEFRIGFL